MSFQAPLFLLFLAAIPVTIAAYVLSQGRARRYAVRFPAAATVAAVLPRTTWRRHIPVALFTAALATLFVALARPEATVAVPVEEASVMLVTDSSGSMRANDVDPTRLDAARNAADKFLGQVPDQTRVGVVGFSDAPNTVIRPTDDRDTAREALDRLSADGGTATGDAMQAALDALKPAKGTRTPPSAIVLLSDGARTTGKDPVAVARAAKKAGIPVYTVSLGTDNGAVETPQGPLSVPPDPEAMAAVAQASGGESFSVSDGDQLSKIYERLGSQLGTKHEKREITVGFTAAGGILLALALAGSLRRFARLPDAGRLPQVQVDGGAVAPLRSLGGRA
jgi:Ca-activated chloride channel family protein